MNGGRRRQFARADPASRAGVTILLAVLLPDLGSTPGGQAVRCRRGVSCRAAQQLTTFRRGRGRRLRKLRVLSFAKLQVRRRSRLLTGCELAAPRSSLSELGHLTTNGRSHRLRRRHKAQDALASGGSGGPCGGVLARRRRI